MSRDRDHQLEQALTHELRATGTPDREACADAETLGAWADNGLDAAQMAAVEWHVSTCARCQAIVGATARSAPPSAGTEAAGRFFLWRWWLAPLAATAAAVTLWMVAPKPRDIILGPSVSPPSLVAPASETVAQNQPKDQAIPIDSAAGKSVDTRSALADRAQSANTLQKTGEARREPPAEDAGKKEAGLVAKRDEADAQKQKPLKDTATAADATAASATAASAPTAPAPTASAPTASSPTAAAPIAARPSAPAVGVLQERAGFAATPLEIVSPDPSSRWRILNGAIERSEDGGATWIAIRASDGQAITGGAAPTRLICWLIGPSGLVMVTGDGRTFTRVPLPERVDLTAITATDARTAIVTTADGRRFRTNDAGRTWRQI
jgi:Putative zinc-finger